MYSFREVKLCFVDIRENFKPQNNMTIFIPKKEFSVKDGIGMFYSVAKRKLSDHCSSQGLR